MDLSPDVSPIPQPSTRPTARKVRENQFHSGIDTRWRHDAECHATAAVIHRLGLDTDRRSCGTDTGRIKQASIDQSMAKRPRSSVLLRMASDVDPLPREPDILIGMVLDLRMVEIASALFGFEAFEHRADGSPSCLNGSRVLFAQQRFDLRKHLLNGIEIGAVCRQSSTWCMTAAARRSRSGHQV
jgi:hypothetical protein